MGILVPRGHRCLKNWLPEGPLVKYDNLRQQLDHLTGILGTGNVYVELQKHGSQEQEARNQALVELAERKLPFAYHQWK